MKPGQLDNEHDVIVIGAGPSGLMAGIAAARTGARTLIVERYGFVGGMPTAAATGPISPFHFRDEQVIKGIPQEFIDRMVALGGSTGHGRCVNPHGSGYYVCIYDRETYKRAGLELLRESCADVLFHSYFVRPILKDGAVRGVTVVNKSGEQNYRAKVVVDASGDGDVAASAGVPFVLGREGDNALQPVTLMFEMAGVDVEALRQYVDDHHEEFEWGSDFVVLRPLPAHVRKEHFVAQGFLTKVKEGLDSGELELGRDSILFWTTLRDDVIHFNSTRVHDIDGTDASSLSYGEIQGRRQVDSLAAFIRKHLPGFTNAYVSLTGSQIGVRESRHILGEYVLTGRDVMEGRKFSDVIARGYFPIDIHNVNGREGYTPGGGTWTDLGEPYDIPYRTLLPKDVDGLLIAGRAISATHEAHGSFRTQGGVMAIGQAAGTAAGLAALEAVEPRQLAVDLLQNRLKQDGASLERDPDSVRKHIRMVREQVEKHVALRGAKAVIGGGSDKQWMPPRL